MKKRFYLILFFLIMSILMFFILSRKKEETVIKKEIVTEEVKVQTSEIKESKNDENKENKKDNENIKEIYLNGNKTKVIAFLHEDHYHIIYKGNEYIVTEKQYLELLEENNNLYFDAKNKKLLTKTNTKETAETIILKEKAEIIANKDQIIAKYKHDDHYHIKLKDGREYIVYENPDNFLNIDKIENKVEVTKITPINNLFTKIIKHNDFYYVLHQDKAYILNQEEYDKSINANNFIPLIENLENEYDAKLTELSKQTKVSKNLIAYKDKVFYIPHDDHLHLVSYDTIQINNQETEILKDMNLEEQESIRLKKQYLSYVFGKNLKGEDVVPIQAIRLYKYQDKLYFSYNEPMMEYDPTHIHPVSVLVDRVIIPERSDDLEIDYLNELEATAIRVNIIPEELRVENGRFFIPSGNHEHSIKIKSSGQELYEKNRISVPKLNKQEGELNVETVLEKSKELLEISKTKLSEKEYRYVARALDYFDYKLLKNQRENFVENSTVGFIESLDLFANIYIFKTIDENIKTDEEIILENKVNEIENILKDSSFIRKTDLGGIEKNKVLETIQTLEENKDLEGLENVKNYLDKLLALHSRPSIMLMSYTEFFLRHVDNYSLSEELRNELAYLIIEMNDANVGSHLFARIIQAYQEIKNEAITFNVSKTYYGYEETPLTRLDSPKMGSFGTFKEDIYQMVDSVRYMLEIIND